MYFISKTFFTIYVLLQKYFFILKTKASSVFSKNEIQKKLCKLKSNSKILELIS